MGKVWAEEIKELLDYNGKNEISEALKELQKELKDHDVIMNFEIIHSEGLIWIIRINDKRILITEKEIGRTDKTIFDKVDDNYNPIEYHYVSVAKEKLQRIILGKLNQFKSL